LDRGEYKVAEFVESVRCRHATLDETVEFFHPELLLNMNTPEDVARARDRLIGRP
jgi:hypothetical protein